MRRFQKDKKYIRQDYKAMRSIQQIHLINNLPIKLRVSTPSHNQKQIQRSIPRHIQQSLAKSSLSTLARSQNQQNINIEFKSIVKKAQRLKSYQPNCSFYKQFVELQKETKNYISYYDSKHQNKFIQLIAKEKESQHQPYVILLIFKDKYPSFIKSNLFSRKLLALEINPDDDFDHIDWKKYFLLRKLMMQKIIPVPEGIKYLCRFFVSIGQNSIKKDEFIYLISSVLRPHNSHNKSLQKVTLLDSVLQRINKEQKMSKQELSLKEIKQILLKQSLFDCKDFLIMMFEY